MGPDGEQPKPSPDNVNTNADGSNGVLPEAPKTPWWQKIIGNKGRAAVAATAMVAGTVGADMALDGPISTTAGNIAAAGEGLIKPDPIIGSAIEEDKISKVYIVSSPPDAEGKQKPPKIRMSPSGSGKEITNSNISPDTVFEGRDVWGNSYNGVEGYYKRDENGQFRPAKVDENGNLEESGPFYGKWFAFKGKDENGEPAEYYVSWSFLKDAEEVPDQSAQKP